VKRSSDETIAAIATPLGVGGVGIVRVSGEKAKGILKNLFVSANGNQIDSHHMLYGWLVNPKGRSRVDQVLACYMKRPASYTGEDLVEIYCHGGGSVLRTVLEMVLACGARSAERGEFTKRAYLNGKVDLAQAEAVLDLIKAPTAESAGYAVRQLEGRLSGVVHGVRSRLLGMLAGLEASIDFPDDLPSKSYKPLLKNLRSSARQIDGLLRSAQRGRVYREGLATVIVGKPNVGKSSLLNALLKEERAIVTDVPGTTRDALEEMVDVAGLPFRIIDTAGLRHPRDKVEEFGVRRTEQELSSADFVIAVVDGSRRLSEDDRQVIKRAAGRGGVVALNKSDLGSRAEISEVRRLSKGLPVFRISALFGAGIEALKSGMVRVVLRRGKGPSRDAVLINARHKECLSRARSALEKAMESAGQKQPLDCLTIDLKDAIVALGEVTGELVSDEVINTIFDRFCVGK